MCKTVLSFGFQKHVSGDGRSFSFVCCGLELQAAETKMPCLMALDDEGNIVVTDEGSHRLHVFQPTDGVLLRTIGSFGTQPGQFIGPRAVAFCGHGNIVVADTLNNRVQVLRYVEASRWFARFKHRH